MNFKMKTLKVTCFILFLSLIFIACEKEEQLVQVSSLIELELKEFVKTNNLKKCTIREFQNGQFWDPVQNSSFRFSNGFIITTHYYWSVEVGYNLENLYNYRKESGQLYLEFVKY
jgi:hypothetical protein